MTDTFKRVDRPATAHGWVRMAERDTATFDAWEMPNGMLFPAPKGTVPMLATIVRHEDPAP